MDFTESLIVGLGCQRLAQSHQDIELLIVDLGTSAHAGFGDLCELFGTVARCIHLRLDSIVARHASSTFGRLELNIRRVRQKWMGQGHHT
jgi:hypothetical protein